MGFKRRWISRRIAFGSGRCSTTIQPNTASKDAAGNRPGSKAPTCTLTPRGPSPLSWGFRRLDPVGFPAAIPQTCPGIVRRRSPVRGPGPFGLGSGGMTSEPLSLSQ